MRRESDIVSVSNRLGVAATLGLSAAPCGVGCVLVVESDPLSPGRHDVGGGGVLPGVVATLAPQSFGSICDVVDDRRWPLWPGHANGGVDHDLRLE